MSKTSPTQRTLAALRKDGWTAQVVERWNAFAKVRIDLFGVIDVLAIKPGIGILGVQATSGSNLAARMTKSADSDLLRLWSQAGGLYEVWAWRKLKRSGKWEATRMRRKDEEWQPVT